MNEISLCPKKRFLSVCAGVLAVFLSAAAHADMFDALNKGLSKAQQAVQQGKQLKQNVSQLPNLTQQLPQQALAVGENVLTQRLVSQLGITPQQAQGGAGALLQLAKARMSQQAFQSLTQSVPEFNGLLAQAAANPPLVNLAQAAIGQNSTLMGMAQVVSTFKSLNLSPDSVQQFVPVIVDYAKARASEQVTQALISALLP